MVKLALSALISVMFASAAIAAPVEAGSAAPNKKLVLKKRQPARVAAANTGDRVVKRVIKVNG